MTSKLMVLKKPNELKKKKKLRIDPSYCDVFLNINPQTNDLKFTSRTEID